MHHLYHMRNAWKRSCHLAYSGVNSDLRAGLRAESRGHRRHGGGSGFGVRRPLRYLAYQLDLDDGQTRQVAAILNRLKTEQEQAALDEKRTVNAVASLLTRDAPLDEELRVALAPRVDSARHLETEVRHAIQSLHAVLDDDQRARLSELLNSGAMSI